MSDTFFKTRGDELGLTIRKVADELGMTTAAVGNWWRGETSPDIAIADRVATVFKVSTAKMLSVIHECAKAKSEHAAAK